MKKVLWISRHRLSPEQQQSLEKQCGGSFQLIWWKENVDDLEALAAELEAADLIAAVLPLHLLARLTELVPRKPILIPLAQRVLVSTGGAEDEVRFTHGGWQRIRKLVVELETVE